jgi:hypothetical protein
MKTGRVVKIESGHSPQRDYLVAEHIWNLLHAFFYSTHEASWLMTCIVDINRDRSTDESLRLWSQTKGSIE